MKNLIEYLCNGIISSTIPRRGETFIMENYNGAYPKSMGLSKKLVKQLYAKT